MECKPDDWEWTFLIWIYKCESGGIPHKHSSKDELEECRRLHSKKADTINAQLEIARENRKAEEVKLKVAKENRKTVEAQRRIAEHFQMAREAEAKTAEENRNAAELRVVEAFFALSLAQFNRGSANARVHEGNRMTSLGRIDYQRGGNDSFAIASR